MTRFWDGRTDGVTRLLHLLSPLVTQVKTTVLFICIHKGVKSIVFAMFIKFFNESGKAILKSIKIKGS